MGIYSTVMETATEVTGLSPTAFFTILAMTVAVYNIVSGMFLGPEDFRQKPEKEPIQIYDVSSSKMFYGRGGACSMFTGKDASRALAMLSFKPEDLTGNLEGLSAEELGVLEDWESKFIEKYPVVGRVVTSTNSSENGDNVQIQSNDRNEQIE
ncbi:putative steroid-binding protein 3 [Hibiscus syriacus]|uniref:Steroid-binding protein 3 n=1 Tax=Hibiscus syriacus TaxID=106335 RepID=A0A6A2WJE5_HIBSY|nr:putative steroid-binding protein 3 [Hibiscus syriacus]